MSPVIRRLARPAALTAAVVLVVALANSPASGAFTTTTADGGNAVTAAADFCPAGTTTVTAAGDSYVDAGAPTATNGSATSLLVRAGGPVRRALVRFALPPRGATCVLTSATLELYATSVAIGQTIQVRRASHLSPQWTSAGVTWDTQPAQLGTAVTAASDGPAGWRSWDVTAHVAAQYTDGNNGFVISDIAATGSATAEQAYADLQHATNKPRLVVTWG